METKTKNNGAVQGAATKTKEAAKTQNRPNLTGKEAKNETIKDQTPAQAPQGGEAKAAEIKAGNAVTGDNKPADPAEQSERKELKLEDKLKAVDNLHRLSVQRLNLISRMKQIEAFEVALVQENDELEENPYQGCKLIIEDDKKRQFITTTPGLIRLVAQFIYNACNEKKAEMEANIVFPNA